MTLRFPALLIISRHVVAGAEKQMNESTTNSARNVLIMLISIPPRWGLV